jgi:site-specific recombinase XerD
VTAWEDAQSITSLTWSRAVAASQLTSSTSGRYAQIFDSFCRYAAATGTSAPSSVTPELCRRFIWAPRRGGRATAAATARLRVTVLVSGFNALLLNGVVASNPAAMERVVHAPAAYVPHPLTPPELSRLLVAGRTTPSDSLRPATLVLALSGATHFEIASAVVADFEIDELRLHLGSKRSRRELTLQPRMAALLQSRVHDLRRIWRQRDTPWVPDQAPIALNRPAGEYLHNSLAPTVGGNLTRALRHAGVTRPEVRPKSLREYAANAAYAEARSMEIVAARLGLTSLDATSRLIDRDWQERWGEVIRRAAET